MLSNKEIEKIFFRILQGGGYKDKIKQRLGHFKDNDWQALLDFSLKCGLFPIFYRRLLNFQPKAGPPGAEKLKNIPSEFLPKLKNLYFSNLKRNLILQRETIKIITHLKKYNIPVIPLKGPFLAQVLYNDISLRQTSADLDILVRPKDAKSAQKHLREIGYVFSCRQYSPDYYYTFTNQIPLAKSNKKLTSIALDVHWGLRQRFYAVNDEDFWLNAKKISIDGCKILMPSSEDLLLYLALISMIDDNFIQLKYLYDIHQLITKFDKNLNWSKIIKQAKNLKLETLLFFALDLSRDFFGTDISGRILKKIRPSWLKENLLRRWVNRKNITQPVDVRNKIAKSYSWFYFASSFLYSSSFFGSLAITYKKIFKPMGEVMASYGQPISKKSYFLYIKRFFKPFGRIGT